MLNLRILDLYLLSVFGINIHNTFYESKNSLMRFRTGKLISNEINNIKTEWQAVTYGAYNGWFDGYYKSLIWPIDLFLNIMSWLVLIFYRKKD